MQQNNTPTTEQERIIIKNIRSLSPGKVAQVADFVDFISQKDLDRRLIRSGNKLPEDAFNKVWDNTEDEVYDRL